MVITRQLTDAASASTATDIQLGSCVTEIGQGAFSGYTNLTDVEFPDSLTTIGVRAFSDSTFTSMTIPSGVTSIGSYAFYRPNTVSERYTFTMEGTTPPSLGTNVFYRYRLNNIYVPCNSIDAYKAAWSEYSKYIICNGGQYKVMLKNENDSVLVGCDSSEVTRNDITINATSTTFGDCATSISDVRYTQLGDIVLSSSIKNISSSAFSYVSASSITFVEGLETIGWYAFQNLGKEGSSNVRSVVLPKSMKSISYDAFYNINLDNIVINGDSNVVLGETRNGIYYSIFGSDSSASILSSGGTLTLTNVSSIPSEFLYYDNCGTRFAHLIINNTNSGTTSIGDKAFCNNYIYDVQIDNAIMGSSAFTHNNNLSAITINSGTIGNFAFSGCPRLTNITIGSGVTSIGRNAFSNCYRLSNITIPDAVTSINQGVFYGCSGLTRLNSSVDGVFNIPSGVTSIGNSAFTRCINITNIDIPSGVTSIGASAFTDCSGLTNVTIPASVLSIGVDAFFRCYGLNSVTINRNTPPTLGNMAFEGPYNLTIYVPAGSVELYKQAQYWSGYADRIQAIPTP